MVKEYEIITKSSIEEMTGWCVAEMKIEDDKTHYLTCSWISEADTEIGFEITDESILDYLCFEDDDDEKYRKIRDNGIEEVYEIDEILEDDNCISIKYADQFKKMCKVLLAKIEEE